MIKPKYKRNRAGVMHKINPKFVWQMLCGKSGQAIHGTSSWNKVSCISCLKFVHEIVHNASDEELGDEPLSDAEVDDDVEELAG